jgi:hypothetical protein
MMKCGSMAQTAQNEWLCKLTSIAAYMPPSAACSKHNGMLARKTCSITLCDSPWPDVCIGYDDAALEHDVMAPSNFSLASKYAHAIAMHDQGDCSFEELLHCVISTGKLKKPSLCLYACSVAYNNPVM